MNISAISSGAHYAPLHQSSAVATAKIKDNDGDYDHGTGADDAVKTKALQTAAQQNLGARVDIKA